MKNIQLFFIILKLRLNDGYFYATTCGPIYATTCGPIYATTCGTADDHQSSGCLY